MTPSALAGPGSAAQSSSKDSQSKQISNPRRLLILSPTSHSISIIPPLLHSLTDAPVVDPPTSTSFAGYTTHPPLRIKNKYYTADVPIWVDEIPLSESESKSPIPSESYKAATATPTATQWKTEFSGPDARVVRDAIGALIVCIRTPDQASSLPPGPSGNAETSERPQDRDDVRNILGFLRAIGDVKELIEEERGGGVATVLVLVGKEAGKKNVPDDENEEDLGDEEPFSLGWWEDQLYDNGLLEFEVVSWDPKAEEEEKRNQYGEWQGMRRIKEILETHHWTASSEDPDSGDPLDDDLEEHLLGMDDGEMGFNLEVNELEREMLGLRMAIEHGGDGHSDEEEEDNIDDGDDEIKVESMEALMLRLQAIKDMSAELPESERKRFAAKAVRDIMKEI